VGIEEGKEVQVKGTGKIINKTIAENFPNLKKEMPIQLQEFSRTLNKPDRTSSWHILDKTINTENKERMMKAVTEKISNV
jgi:hypothetical protein